MRAALEGNTDTVRELLQEGVEINQRDENGRTALMFAVMNSHYGYSEIARAVASA